jgi:RNA recognition motif-containing protein
MMLLTEWIVLCVSTAGPFVWRNFFGLYDHISEGNKMEVKLYVGNLSYSTSEDDLRTLFTQAGKVESVDLIKDRYSGQSKGFAFIQMGNQSEAQNAIGMFNGYNLADRELKVSFAKPREERSGFGDRRNDSYGDRNRRGGGGGGNRRGGTQRY